MYQERIGSSLPSNNNITHQMTLYLTNNMNPDEVKLAKVEKFWCELVPSRSYYKFGGWCDSSLWKMHAYTLRDY